MPQAAVGGDFYAFEQIGDSGLIALTADVAGHGLGAALDASAVRIAFRKAVARSHEPREILTLMNRTLTGYVDVNTALLIPAAVVPFCLFAACAPNPAGERQRDLAFWIGAAPSTETGSLSDLQRAEFEPFQGAIRAFGFPKQDVWIRMSAWNSRKEAVQLVVRSGSSRVDSVLCLIGFRDGRRASFESADTADVGPGVHPDRMPSFLVALESGEEAQVYLRYRSRAALVVEPSVLPLDQVGLADCGRLCHVHYSCVQPPLPCRWGARTRPPSALRALRLLQWSALFGLLAPLAEAAVSVGRFVNIGGALVGVLVICAGVLAIRRGLPESRLFLFGWSFVVIGVLWRTATILRLVPPEFTSAYSVQIGTLAENLVFAFMLGVRHRRSDLERAQLGEQVGRVERELAAARRIHAQLLVPPPERLPYDVSVHYAPHSGVGGDFYAFGQDDRGRLLVLLADVSGRGLSAALGAATVRLAFLDACAESAERAEPAAILSAMNNYVAPFLDGRLVLAVCVSIDFEERRVRMAAAEDSPGATVINGKAAPLPISGPPLGAAPGYSYEEKVVALGSGEAWMILYTDGLLHSAAGRNPADARTIVLSVAEGLQPGSTDFGERVLRQVSGARDGRGLDDDATILAFRFPPVSGSAVPRPQALHA